MRVRCRACREAFTLIELVITIMIAGIVLTALFAGFYESMKLMRTQRDIRRAAALSEDLMNEVRSKPYDGIYTGTVNVRADCVGVDDYHLWFESPPQTMNGSVMSDFEGFARRVLVELIDQSGFDFNAPPVTNDVGLKRIIVLTSNDLVAVSNASVVSRYDR